MKRYRTVGLLVQVIIGVAYGLLLIAGENAQLVVLPVFKKTVKSVVKLRICTIK